MPSNRDAAKEGHAADVMVILRLLSVDSSASKFGVQGDTVIVRDQGGGLTIEMIVNRITGNMITAYPVDP